MHNNVVLSNVSQCVCFKRWRAIPKREREREKSHPYNSRMLQPHSFCLLSFLPFFPVSLFFGRSHREKKNKKQKTQFGTLEIVCSACAPSSLSHILLITIRRHLTPWPDCIWWEPLLKFFKASRDLPSSLPNPLDQQNGYRRSNLHHSRFIEIMFLFAFLCLGSLGRMFKKWTVGEAPGQIMNERLFICTFCRFWTMRITAYSLELIWSGYIWKMLDANYI